jgi:hypothetical protein
VVNMANSTNVTMWLRAFKLFLCHILASFAFFKTNNKSL